MQPEDSESGLTFSTPSSHSGGEGISSDEIEILETVRLPARVRPVVGARRREHPFIAPSGRSLAALRRIQPLPGRPRSTWVHDDAILGAANLAATVFPGTGVLDSLHYSSFLEHGAGILDRFSPWSEFEAYERILLPINLGAHWVAAVIRPAQCSVTLFDSMHRGEGLPAFADEVLDFLDSWVRPPRHRSLAACFERQGVPGQLPGDSNSCGVFVVARLIESAAELPHLFSAALVPSLRRALAASLARGHLTSAALPPFSEEAARLLDGVPHYIGATPRTGGPSPPVSPD